MYAQVRSSGLFCFLCSDIFNVCVRSICPGALIVSFLWILWLYGIILFVARC